jgi:hypothetical protein
MCKTITGAGISMFIIIIIMIGIVRTLVPRAKRLECAPMASVVITELCRARPPRGIMCSALCGTMPSVLAEEVQLLAYKEVGNVMTATGLEPSL